MDVTSLSIPEFIGILFGTGGASSFATRWLLMKRSREQAIDARYDTLLNQYKEELGQLRSHISSMLQSQSAQSTQLAVLHAEAQAATAARARMHTQYDDLATEHAALKRDLAARQEEIVKLTRQLAEAKDRITEYEMQQSSYVVRINELESEVKSLQMALRSSPKAMSTITLPTLKASADLPPRSKLQIKEMNDHERTD